MTTQHRKPLKIHLHGTARSPTVMWPRMMLFLGFLISSVQGTNPPAPVMLTWRIINTATGDIINSTSSFQAPGTWWPELHFDLCRLAAGSWDIGHWAVASKGRPECGEGKGGCTLSPSKGRGPGCGHLYSRHSLRQTPFYICPEGGRDRSEVLKCGGAESFYCKEWGCESTGTVYWTPPVKDLITVKRVPQTPLASDPRYGRCASFLCNPVSITWTEEGRRFSDWGAGRTWGLRLYQSGYDQGLLFTIQQVAHQDVLTEGPSKVLGGGPA